MQDRGVMGGIPRSGTELAKAPAPPLAPPKEQSLSLSHSDEDLRPGLLVHVACEHARPGPGVLRIEAPAHTWESHTASASAGFNLLLDVAGRWRLTLSQPTTPDGDDWEAVANLSVEVSA